MYQRTNDSGRSNYFVVYLIVIEKYVPRPEFKLTGAPGL